MAAAASAALSADGSSNSYDREDSSNNKEGKNPSRNSNSNKNNNSNGTSSSATTTAATGSKDSTIHVDGFHKWVRVVCMLAIGSMLAFGLFNEVSRSQTQRRENITHAPDMHKIDQPWNRVGGKIDELVEKPSLVGDGSSGSGRRTSSMVPPLPPEPVSPGDQVSSPPKDKEPPTDEEDGINSNNKKDQVVLSHGSGGKVRRGDDRPTPTYVNGKFPTEEAQSVSSPADVVDKSIYTPEKYTCIQEVGGGERSTSAGYRYQHVFLPIGCWGNELKKGACSQSDPSRKKNNGGEELGVAVRLPKTEDLEICRLGERLAQVTSCGHNKFGSFLGDNFYPWGIEKRSSRLEVESTEKFWRHPSLQMPYYVTAGNHDNQGKSSIKPQFRFNHSFWKFPAIHHTSPLMTGPDGKTSVQLFLFSTHWGGKKLNPYMASEAEWLDEQLSASTARWKIVATHEPIWGFMGFPHQEMMVKHIHPVLVKHKIRLVVVAHQHSVSIHQNKGGYYQLTSAGFYPAHIHEFAKPNRPVGRFHLGMGATMVLIDYDRIDVVGFDKNFNLIWDASIPFFDADDNDGQGGGRKGGEVYGNQEWVPQHSATFEPDNGGPKDYWVYLPQCEAQKPKLCRR